MKDKEKGKKKGKIFITIVINLVVAIVLIFAIYLLRGNRIYRVGFNIDAGEYILLGNGEFKIGNKSDKNYGYYQVNNIKNSELVSVGGFTDKAYVILEEGQLLKTKHAKLYKVNEYEHAIEDSISYNTNYMFETYYKVGYDLSAGTYTFTGDDFFYKICSKPTCKISSNDSEMIEIENVKGSKRVTLEDGQYLLIGGKAVTATK